MRLDLIQMMSLLLKMMMEIIFLMSTRNFTPSGLIILVVAKSLGERKLLKRGIKESSLKRLSTSRQLLMLVVALGCCLIARLLMRVEMCCHLYHSSQHVNTQCLVFTRPLIGQVLVTVFA
jgi:hypothetical protein